MKDVIFSGKCPDIAIKIMFSIVPVLDICFLLKTEKDSRLLINNLN